MSEDRKPFTVELRPGCKKTTLARFGLALYQGENWIVEPEVVKSLLEDPGSVAIDNVKAQEAVDLGYVSADEVAEMGYEIQIGVEDDGKPIYAEAKKKDPVRLAIRVPDFGKYSEPELHAYAERDGLVLKGDWGYDQKVQACHDFAMAQARRIEAMQREDSAKAPVQGAASVEAPDRPRAGVTPPVVESPSTPSSKHLSRRGKKKKR